MAGRVEHAHEDHDAVEYRLYPEIPEGYGERECEIYLEDQVDLYLAHLSRVLVDYVWQNEAFHLSVVPKNTAGKWQVPAARGARRPGNDRWTPADYAGPFGLRASCLAASWFITSYVSLRIHPCVNIA